MSDVEPSKPRPWWRRALSLRALMAVVLVVGGGLGWVAYRAKVQREAVAAIEAAGGMVVYDWATPGPSGQPRSQFPWPRWLVDALGPDYFGNVAYVHARDFRKARAGFSFTRVNAGTAEEPGRESPFDDALLAQIGRLGHLRQLVLSETAVTDAGLVHLRGLGELEFLSLGHCRGVTDGGLAHLGGLTRLKRLDLGLTGCEGPGLAQLARLSGLEELLITDVAPTDVDLTHLAGLTSLKRLSLSGARLTDAGLAPLSGLKDLKDLEFFFGSSPRVTGAGLKHLAGLDRLETLALQGTGVDNLEHLKGLTGLKRLDLNRTPIDDAGLAAVGGLRGLETLSLGNTRVDDAGLAHLVGLDRLAQVDLWGPRITDAGLAHLAGLPKLQHLTLLGTNVSDASLARLAEMSSLRFVFLSGSKTTPAGVAALQKALSGVQIVP